MSCSTPFKHDATEPRSYRGGCILRASLLAQRDIRWVCKTKNYFSLSSSSDYFLFFVFGPFTNQCRGVVGPDGSPRRHPFFLITTVDLHHQSVVWGIACRAPHENQTSRADFDCKSYLPWQHKAFIPLDMPKLHLQPSDARTLPYDLLAYISTGAFHRSGEAPPRSNMSKDATSTRHFDPIFPSDLRS